ncbi:MAG: hypothetical protein MHPSP_002902 [Paramarteilia canceri]
MVALEKVGTYWTWICAHFKNVDLDQIWKAGLENSSLHKVEGLHCSFSRNFDLTLSQYTCLQSKLKHSLQPMNEEILSSRIFFDPEILFLPSHTENKTFVVLKLWDMSDTLVKILRKIDEIVEELDLEPYFKGKLFHMSIFTIEEKLENLGQKKKQAILDLLNPVVKTLDDQELHIENIFLSLGDKLLPILK